MSGGMSGTLPCQRATARAEHHMLGTYLRPASASLHKNAAHGRASALLNGS